jgi:hypothetical protein
MYLSLYCGIIHRELRKIMMEKGKGLEFLEGQGEARVKGARVKGLPILYWFT